MIEPGDLAALDAEVGQALTHGDDSGLNVIGYGEISTVLGWPLDDPRWACKRLPLFPTDAAVDDYAATLDRYLAEVRSRGVDVVDTEVQRVRQRDGRVAVYCVQPALAPGTLAVDAVRRGGEGAEWVLAAIVEAVFGVVDERVGLDAQLSNWGLADGRLCYFDVTTPLLRRPDGTEALDTGLFLASLPWLLRPPVRRFLLRDIIERYHRPRTVALDLAANLVKERLDSHIGAVVSAAADRVDPPLTEDEVRADYRSDARTWALLLSLRRADRVWQQRVRRRPYPFLLPGPIER
ncbi:MAG TPA: DUF6206 family protein [Acidimicrobiales bacterium]